MPDARIVRWIHSPHRPNEDSLNEVHLSAAGHGRTLEFEARELVEPGRLPDAKASALEAVGR